MLCHNIDHNNNLQNDTQYLILTFDIKDGHSKCQILIVILSVIVLNVMVSLEYYC